jgi:seryl-tRNA synthetase
MFGLPKYVKIKKSDFYEIERKFYILKEENKKLKNENKVLKKENKKLLEKINDYEKDEVFFNKIQELKEENEKLKKELEIITKKKELYEKMCYDILPEYKKLKNEEEKTIYLNSIDFLY